MNALEIIDSPPVAPGTMTRAMAILEANFGSDISKEKASLLFDMVREEGWSEKRFDLTLKWFLKNKSYASWTIADWFAYGVKLYPEAWYKLQCVPGSDIRKKMDRYKLADGVIGYKWKDNIEIPLEKLPDIQ